MKGTLKTLRKSQKMTLKSLSDKTGLSPQHISLIELGKHFPTLKTRKKLEIYFGILGHEIDWTSLFILNAKRKMQKENI